MPGSQPILWVYFPKSDAIPAHLLEVISVFTYHQDSIDSDHNSLESNEVLGVVSRRLMKVGFTIEGRGKVPVPVLFGMNGKPEKSFYADGFSPTTKTVLEVEAGRAYDNNQFLKDLFQACMMQDVQYLVVAVRRTYRGKSDFGRIAKFFDTLYVSRRLSLPLKGILLIGY